MRGDQIALLGSLAWRFPKLREALNQHLADNHGEILPHPLMSEYERWAQRAILEGDTQLSEFLRTLEDAYVTGGDEIENLIAVSFLEHLPRPGEAGAEIRDWLGPAMQHQLDVIG